MAEITLRVPLGRPLTYQEVDDNFRSVQELTLLAQSFALTAQEASTLADEAKNEAIAAKDEALIASGSAALDAQRAEDAADRAEAIADFDGLHNTLAGRDVPGAHDASAISFRQEGEGAVERSLEDKAQEVISVRDYIKTPVDGVTSNQDGIVAAVAAAYAIGAQLEWPVGTYVSTASIPHLHEVSHTGRGAIKRGADIFFPNILNNQENKIYCAPAHSGDGLSASEPFNFTEAHKLLQNYGPELQGKWQIILSAGEHIAPVEFSGVSSKNYLVIKGPVSNNTSWGAVIKPSGASTLYFRDGLVVNLLDVDVTNDGGSWAAVNLDKGCFLWLRDCRVRDANFAGVNSNIGTRTIIDGCVIQDIANTGFLIYNATGATGYSGRRTTIQRCGIAVGIQAGYGHIDDTDISDCSFGLSLARYAHTSNYNNTYTNISVAVESNGPCTVNTAGCTYTNVSTKQRDYPYGGDDYDATITDGSGYRFNKQYYRHLGNSGRWAYGYMGRVVPTVPFQYSNGTSVGVNLANYGPATALYESNGNTILALASQDSNFSAVWFGKGTVPNAAEIRRTGDDIMLRSNSATTLQAGTSYVRPGTDNAQDLGSSMRRWAQVYASTGAINTSDAKEKQQIRALSEAEHSVAVRLKSLIRAFKFNDAVESKGVKARIHVGIIAQDVIFAFESEGLDASQYGILCYDEWEETPEIKEPILDVDGNETGEFEITQEYQPAGNRYGIRYDQLLAFIISAL